MSEDAGSRPPAPAAGRLLSIDALRGLGALMVLAQHSVLGEPVLLPALTGGAPAGSLLFCLLYPLIEGSRGVNLFLVVSGFCIHYRSARRNPNVNPDFLPFWVRRLWRLYPPFLAAVGLGLAIHVIALWLFHPEILHWTPDLLMQGISGGAGPFLRDMVVHLLMLFPFVPHAATATDGAVFWSLSLEEHLYLLYFLLPLLRRRLGMPGTVLVSLVVTMAWRAVFILGVGVAARVPPVAMAHALHGAAPPDMAMDWLDMGPARWFEWMLGAWAVEMALGQSARPPWTRHMGLAAGMLILGMLTEWWVPGWIVTDALWGLGFFICLNRLVEREQRGLGLSRWVQVLARVGLFSYSLYLTHYQLVHLVKYLLQGYIEWYLAYPLAGLLCIPFAYLFYRLFELPAIVRSHRTADQTRPS